jgi:hypothetical protein
MIRIGPALADGAGVVPAAEGGAAELFGSLLAGVAPPAAAGIGLEPPANSGPDVTLAEGAVPLPSEKPVPAQGSDESGIAAFAGMTGEVGDATLVPANPAQARSPAQATPSPVEKEVAASVEQLLALVSPAETPAISEQAKAAGSDVSVPVETLPARPAPEADQDVDGQARGAIAPTPPITAAPAIAAHTDPALPGATARAANRGLRRDAAPADHTADEPATPRQAADQAPAPRPARSGRSRLRPSRRPAASSRSAPAWRGQS